MRLVLTASKHSVFGFPYTGAMRAWRRKNANDWWDGRCTRFCSPDSFDHVHLRKKPSYVGRSCRATSLENVFSENIFQYDSVDDEPGLMLFGCYHVPDTGHAPSPSRVSIVRSCNIGRIELPLVRAVVMRRSDHMETAADNRKDVRCLCSRAREKEIIIIAAVAAKHEFRMQVSYDTIFVDDTTHVAFVLDVK